MKKMFAALVLVLMSILSFQSVAAGDPKPRPYSHQEIYELSKNQWYFFNDYYWLDVNTPERKKEFQAALDKMVARGKNYDLVVWKLEGTQSCSQEGIYNIKTDEFRPTYGKRCVYGNSKKMHF